METLSSNAANVKQEARTSHVVNVKIRGEEGLVCGRVRLYRCGAAGRKGGGLR